MCYWVRNSSFDILKAYADLMMYFTSFFSSLTLWNSSAILPTTKVYLSLLWYFRWKCITIGLFSIFVYIYGIRNWRILRSSYGRLGWVEFEPTTTEFRSDALTDWAIRPWVQLALRANFVQIIQFHLFVQCSRFISVCVCVCLLVYFFTHVCMHTMQCH